MKLTETLVGGMLTVQLTDAMLDGNVSAALSGIVPHRYALIDGLLWYSLNRRLEALWRAVQVVEPTIATKRGHDVANGLYIYVTTVPFHDVPEEKQARILHHIGNYLPELDTLATRTGDKRVPVELAALKELATLLQTRIAYPNDAGHGLEGILTSYKAAA